MNLVHTILVIQEGKSCGMTEFSIKISEEELRGQVMCSMFDFLQGVVSVPKAVVETPGDWRCKECGMPA